MKETDELRQLILDKAVKFNQGNDYDGNAYDWLIDCREVIMDPKGAKLITEVLNKKFEKFESSTVGGLTLVSTLMVSMLIHRNLDSEKPVNGFFMRYKPKEIGLQKTIEGTLQEGEKAVIVDDILRSNGLIFEAIRKAEDNGISVEGVIGLICYDKDVVEELKGKGYKVEYLFTLEDLLIKQQPVDDNSVDFIWEINHCNNWNVLIPRSSPINYKENIIFGTNEGLMLSINKSSGKTTWKYDTGTEHPKGILSTPTIYEDNIYFGAYDGYIYCVDATEGTLVWKKKLGDWIGSSPCIHKGVLYIGVEYGAKGGILIACSIKDGKKLWELKTNHYIHSSPKIDPKNGVVVVGCNDGFVYAADVNTGMLKWKYFTGKETRAGFVIEDGRAYFGSFDGNIYCIGLADGNVLWKRNVGAAVYSTPEIVNEAIVFSTVSKRIFSMDKKNGSIKWYYNTEEKILSYTTTINGLVYCGSTDGFLHILDFETGKPVRKYNIGKPMLSKPLVEGNDVYISCKGKILSIRTDISKTNKPLELKLHVHKEKIQIPNEIANKFSKPTIFYMKHNDDERNFLVSFVIMDFNKSQYTYITSYSEENRRLVKNHADESLFRVKSNDKPHSTIIIDPESEFITFTQLAGYIFHVNFKEKVLRIITGKTLDCDERENIQKFGDTVYKDEDDPNYFYFTAISNVKVEKNEWKFSIAQFNLNCPKKWEPDISKIVENKIHYYRTDLRMEKIEKIHESYESFRAPHVTKKYKGILYNSEFYLPRLELDNKAYHSFEELYKHILREIFKDFCIEINARFNEENFSRSLSWDGYDYKIKGAFGKYFEKTFKDADFKQICNINNRFIWKALSGRIALIDLKNKESRIYETTYTAPAHFEIDEKDDFLYTSSHNFIMLDRHYFIGPAAIDKFKINDRKLEKIGTFQNPKGYRMAHHAIFHYMNRPYVATFGQPNRLFIINADTMELYHSEDIEKDILSGQDNIADLLNYSLSEEFEKQAIIVSDDGSLLLLFGYNGIHIFSVPEKRIIYHLGFIKHV